MHVRCNYRWRGLLHICPIKMTNKIEIQAEGNVEVYVNGLPYKFDTYTNNNKIIAERIIKYIKTTEEYEDLMELRLGSLKDKNFLSIEKDKNNSYIICFPMPHSNTEWTIAMYNLVLRIEKDKKMFDAYCYICHIDNSRHLYFIIN